MAKVSFAKVPGAGSSAPVEEVKPAEAEVVDSQAGANAQPTSTDTRVAAPAQTQVTAPRFYAGDEDDVPTDAGDVRLPRLNLIQGLSDPELKKIGPDGSFVLKRTLLIPQPARIVVAGCSKKRYAEKLPKFGEGTPRIFDTLEQVASAGGTDQWKFSRENKDQDGVPVSRKPWFQPMVTALLLIEKPEKLAKPEDEEHFTAISDDGKAFAPCVYTVKSTAFGGFYVPLNSERVAGVLKAGFSSHYVRLTSKQVRAFEPVVSILEPTSDAVRKLAKSLLV